MSDFYAKWKKDSEAYKPSPETDQHVLYLKQMALMSPHFKEARDGTPLVSEKFLNACMQLAYLRGSARVEQSSYEKGYEAAMQEVARKLGFDCTSEDGQ